MTQEATVQVVLDDGPVLQPRLPSVYTLGLVAEDGQVLGASIDRDWGPIATTPNPPGAPTQSSVLPEATVEVVDLDLHHVTWLPRVRPQFAAREEARNSGAVTATLARTDPALALLPKEFVLRYYRQGTLVAAGLHKTIQHRERDQAEEAGQQATIGGTGTFDILDDATVDPWKLDWDVDMQAHRFGPYHPTFQIGGYDLASVKALQGDVSPRWTGYPVGWIHPTAGWISGGTGNSTNAPQGDTWLWKDFTSAGGDRSLWWTGDNVLEVWIDGVPFQTTQDWHRLQELTFTLSAGVHRIACKLTNEAPTDPDFNPMGALVALAERLPGGKYGDLELITDGTWRVLQFPAQPPAMPLGQIINYLLDMFETQTDRNIARTFTDLLDTNGVPWPLVTDLTIQVGTAIGQALRQLAETYCDFRMSNGSWELSAWVRGTSGQLRATVLTQSGDSPCLTSLDHQIDPPIATSLLVRWANGWTRLDRDPPEGWERRTKHLQAPALPTRAAAIEMGDQLLGLYSQEQVQSTAGIRPRIPAQVPGRGFRARDIITIDAPDGGTREAPVMAWSSVVDVHGHIDDQAEIGDVILNLTEAMHAQLQRMADGAIDGISAQPQPTRPDSFPITNATVTQLEQIFDRAKLTFVAESGAWSVPFPVRVTEIVVTNPEGGSGLLEFKVNGTVEININLTGDDVILTGVGLALDRYDKVTVRSEDLGFPFVLTVRAA